MYMNTISTAHDQETELEVLEKEIREVDIVIANPTSNRNYVKNLGKPHVFLASSKQTIFPMTEAQDFRD